MSSDCFQGRIWLFDLDGTLVDTCADLTEAVNVMRKELALPALSDAAVAPMLGNGMKKLIERALAADAPDLAAKPEVVEHGLQTMRNHYDMHYSDHSKIYPFVVEVLQKIRATGGRSAVVTNKMGDSARGLLDALHMTELLDLVLGDGERIPLKPRPDLAIEAVKRLHGRLENACIVGDNYTDLACGRAAGIRRIFAAYGYGTWGDETGFRTIHSFRELEEEFL